MHFIHCTCVCRKAQPAVNTDELAPLFVSKFVDNAFCIDQLVTIQFNNLIFKAKVLHITGVWAGCEGVWAG